MASTAGGMDIEEVAESHPEKILREWTIPHSGSRPFRPVISPSGLDHAGDQFKSGVS
jgi:succinyl-CoA synthetase beta subunit